MVRAVFAEAWSRSCEVRGRSVRALVIFIGVVSVLTAQSFVRAADAASGPCQLPRCIQGSLTVDGEHMGFDVLLPVGYADSATRYPAVYLLHGAGVYTPPGATEAPQDGWLSNGHVEQFTAALPADQQAIVVMPSSPNVGGWLNWQNGNHDYETAVVKVLIPYVDANFRTIPDRAHRAIAGLSAGGFGSLYYAARYPDLFAAVGTFSGLDDTTDPVIEAFLISAVPGVAALCTISPPAKGHYGCANNAGIKDVLPPSGWGDPVTDQLWFQDHNPGDLAINYRGMSVWLASGNGVPCNSSDAQDVEGIALESVVIRRTNVELDNDLTRAGIAHTTVYRPCGVHAWSYWQADLEQWWPVMMGALGKPSPQTFDFRSADPSFSVWGWDFAADPGRAPEFLTVQGASATGVGLTGSGLTTVTTAPLFVPHSVVGLRGARTSSATADPNGRITFQVDLGPPHTLQEYTVGATAAEAIASATLTGYFVSQTVQFSATT